MVDRNIPPPNIHVNGSGGEAAFEEELDFEEVASFQDYLDKSDRENEDEREQVQEEIIQQESKLKAAMMQEELEDATNIEDAQEEEELDEEQRMSEREAELDEKMGEKSASKRLKRMRSKREKQSEELEEQEEAKHIYDNLEISEKGDHPSLDEDSLEEAKKDVQSEKDELEHIKEEHKAHHEHESDHSKRRIDQKDESRDKTPKQNAATKKHPNKLQPTNQNVAANINLSTSTPASLHVQSQKSHSKKSKSELLKKFEALAQEIISEAHVLENGDVLQTTISLCMEGSEFDGGEVTLTTYKFRPLEVNIEFKKFKAAATRAMKNNSSMLKNVLKENSLKVHQLHIIE